MDMVMSFIAQYALEIYGVMFLTAWLVLPKRDTERRHALVIMVFSGVAALVFNVIISHFWFRPRPFVTLAEGTFTQLIPHTADASFPSDHVSGSFGFAAASWRKSNQWISWTFTSLAVLVAIARLYVGVHWPTDVLAGVIVGIISSRMIWALNAWLKPLTNFGLRLFHYGNFAKTIASDHRKN
jgi:undecaprenyl-diphosphatase